MSYHLIGINKMIEFIAKRIQSMRFYLSFKSKCQRTNGKEQMLLISTEFDKLEVRQFLAIRHVFHIPCRS